MSAEQSQLTDRAERLARMTNTWGLEKNCAQLLVMAPGGQGRPWPLHPARATKIGTLDCRPVTACGAFLGLSIDCIMGLACLHTTYVHEVGHLGVGEVEFLADDFATALGRDSEVDPLRFTHGLLSELQSGFINCSLASHDGSRKRRKLSALEWFVMDEDGLVKAKLPDLVSENLHNDFTAYMDHTLMLRLREADPDACRLWIYAEAQNLKTGLFAAKGLPRRIFPEKRGEKSQVFPIATLLSMTGESSETRVLHTLRGAASTINEIDHKYTIYLDKEASWRVCFRRNDIADQDGAGNDISTESSTQLSPAPSNDQVSTKESSTQEPSTSRTGEVRKPQTADASGDHALTASKKEDEGCQEPSPGCPTNNGEEASSRSPASPGADTLARRLEDLPATEVVEIIRKRCRAVGIPLAEEATGF